MKRGDTVSIYQKPITGEDYEGEGVLTRPASYRQEIIEDGKHTTEWYVVFPEDGNSQGLYRTILVDAEGNPVYVNKAESKGGEKDDHSLDTEKRDEG